MLLLCSDYDKNKKQVNIGNRSGKKKLKGGIYFQCKTGSTYQIYQIYPKRVSCKNKVKNRAWEV